MSINLRESYIEPLDPNTIICSKCGKKHKKTLRNCCWINCSCGKLICGTCGSIKLVDMVVDEDDSDAQYWCCQECADCGLQGCAMCI